MFGPWQGHISEKICSAQSRKFRPGENDSPETWFQLYLQVLFIYMKNTITVVLPVLLYPQTMEELQVTSADLGALPTGRI